MRQPRRGNVGHAVIEPQSGEAAALKALRREIEVRRGVHVENRIILILVSSLKRTCVQPQRLQLLVPPPLRRPKLLVLDVNGLLVHRVFLPSDDRAGKIRLQCATRYRAPQEFKEAIYISTFALSVSYYAICRCPPTPNPTLHVQGFCCL
jgi:hypothetical protein